MRKHAFALAALLLAVAFPSMASRAEVAMSAFEYRRLFESIDDALIRKQYASARDRLQQLTSNSGTEFEITLRQLAAALGMHKEAEAERYADKLLKLTADANQALRGNLLLANNNLYRSMMLGLENEPWKSYCRKSPDPCDEDDMMYADRAIRRFVVLGQPDGERWAPRLIKQLAAEEEKSRQAALDATAAAAARAKEEAAARERARQQEIAEQQAALERARAQQAERDRLAAKAAEEARQEAEWRADLPRRQTFAYQAWFIWQAFLGSFAAVWKDVPWPVYGVALAMGLLLHRQVILKVLAASALFWWMAVLVIGHLYGKSPWQSAGIAVLKPFRMLADYPALLLARGETADIDTLSGAIGLTFPLLALAMYAVAFVGIGADARRAERRRWRAAFDAPMLFIDHVAHWREERRYQRMTLPQPAPAAGAPSGSRGLRGRIPLGEYGKFGFWAARTTLMLFLFWTVWSAGGELWRGLLQALPALVREPIAATADWVSIQVRKTPKE